MKLGLGVISPQDWGLPVATSIDPAKEILQGVRFAELEEHARAATYQWLMTQYNEEIGAFHGFYRAPDRYLDIPQTVNLIAPWQLLAAYDRYQDQNMLDRAVRAANWFYQQHVITHPMSIVAGGVRDGFATEEIWTKFTAEEVIVCMGIWSRTKDPIWLERALQCGRYLIQARRHQFAARFHLGSGTWMTHGWDSWGRVIEAELLLHEATREHHWLEEALHCGGSMHWRFKVRMGAFT